MIFMTNKLYSSIAIYKEIIAYDVKPNYLYPKTDGVIRVYQYSKTKDIIRVYQELKPIYDQVSHP